MAWQVEWLIIWKIIVKMLAHIHMVVYTWRYWHIYKGGGVCRVEMGLGRQDSALSGKWNAYFLLRRMQILVISTLEQG